MPALKGKAIEAFVARRDPATAAVLIYGRALGLVKERAETLARAVVADFKDPFNYVELTEADLKAEPARLADEAIALSFSGGERVVRLRTSGDAAASAAKTLVDGLESGALKPNALTIIEAGDLAKTSKLRKLFEGGRHVVALPCYDDSPADVRAMAAEAAEREGLRFDPEALDLLTAHLGTDRGVSRAEIDKLILFVGPQAVREGGRDTIHTDDVKASLVDASSEALDATAGEAADGATRRLAASLDRLASAGASPIGLLRALQRQFARLRTARAAIDRGASLSDAVSRLRPPVFFAERKPFEARVGRWRTEDLDRVLDLILNAELEAKRTGSPQREIVERLALQLAARAGGRRSSGH